MALMSAEMIREIRSVADAYVEQERDRRERAAREIELAERRDRTAGRRGRQAARA